MSDAFFFIGILILIFVVWVATGGPMRPISWSGPYLTPITLPGGHSTGYSLSQGPAPSTAASTQDTQRSLAQTQQDVVSLEKSLVSATRFGTPSVYKGLVTIRYGTGALQASDPDKEYLTIAVSSRATSGVDLTNWSVESEAVGYSLRIPEGVNLPNSGYVNPTAPIVLEPGQTAIISLGDSPVGYSFRENMCTGYFDQFQDFTPYLNHSCPLPNDDFNRFYVGNQHSLDACEAFVKTVRRCTVPLDTPSDLADDCFHFVNDYLNYNGCVVAHEGDHGFFGTQWRIYLGRDYQFFTKDHDTIKLLDGDGNTVDLISY